MSWGRNREGYNFAWGYTVDALDGGFAGGLNVAQGYMGNSGLHVELSGLLLGAV